MIRRLLTTSTNYKETELGRKLESAFKTKDVKVADISGGCGSMYTVYVASSLFQGMPLVKQHRMVSDALKDEIKLMHGLQITTKSLIKDS